MYMRSRRFGSIRNNGTWVPYVRVVLSRYWYLLVKRHGIVVVLESVDVPIVAIEFLLTRVYLALLIGGWYWK